ncbi:MAG: DNA polymerase III subunit alpha [Bacteroidales bacterium]|jgi:DNA polymerase-3 subunit alpha|nr:DNA polymerase III subunit alpha [Bacteroidales bacterium]
MTDFTHLHVHSQYSILDGAASIEDLVDKAVKCNMKALALTDHGFMFGIKSFYDECKKKNIKPILGCETYVAKNGMHSKDGQKDYSGYHLILIAKNEIGYKNLIKLISEASISGFYMKPRIDHELLKKHSEGLIVSSACLGGEIPKKIEMGDLKGAEEAVLWHKEIFGEDFYLELMRHKTDDPKMKAEVFDRQEKVNPILIEFSRKHNIKLIATNDVHFINEEDAEAHDLLICLTTNADLDDPKRMRYTQQEWFKTPEEMAELFSDIPEAISNTMEIAEKVEDIELDSPPIMPEFEIPDPNFSYEIYKQKYSLEELCKEFGEEVCKRLGKDYKSLLRIKLESDYLEHLTYEGAKKRYGDSIPDNVKERLEFELQTVKSMGFPGYFLIVQDFINEARKQGVLVGPGRGSAAGSAIAYCTEITNVDPLKYNLLFERFLNPDRISMPDVDIDFDDEGREKVLEYVKNKYKEENVAQICTFGTMAAKMAVRDVARILKLPLNEADKLAKGIPDGGSLSNAYKIIIESEEKLGSLDKVAEDIKKQKAFDKKENEGKDENILKTREYILEQIKLARENKNELIIKTLKLASILEGSVRQTGIHACGVLIGHGGLSNHLPLMHKEGVSLLTTQYDGKLVESVGLLKMDFLGLKTLSILKDTLTNIKHSKGKEIDIEKISFEDNKVYELFGRGETSAIFQFESDGMKEHLKNLKPTEFEDLVAMNALYRPGPMDYIPNFIARKNGREEITYDHPIMEQYLDSTYGVTVYQEQVMLLSRALANFSRGESDNLRKAIGKKIITLMAQQKIKFIEGCQNNPEFIKGCTEYNKNPKELAEKIWKDWEAFAKYAFNKSHSVCYAYLAYQTGYLKAYYPSEFMAANLSRNLNDIKEIKKLMEECKRMRINVFGPCINESFEKFTVNNNDDVRFGLSAIKNVGSNAVKCIIQEREKNGKYKSIFDFVERVNLSAVNRKNIEALVYAGAFDSFGINRSQYFRASGNYETFIDALIQYGHQIQSSATDGLTLFGDTITVDAQKPEIPENIEEFNLKILNQEREHVGIYISAHPLDNYKLELESIRITPLSKLDNLKKLINTSIKIVGLITDIEQRTGKNGNPYAFITIEDYSGMYKIAFYGKDYINFNNYFLKGQSILVKGEVQQGYNDVNRTFFKVKEINLLPELRDKYFSQLVLYVVATEINKDFVNRLSKHAKNNKGKLLLNIKLFDKIKKSQLDMFSRTYRVELNDEIIDFLEKENCIKKFNLA